MRCQLCGGPGPVVEVELNHNVGMLVARRTYTTQGQLCKSCLNRAMFEHTWKNLLLGWWGTISFLMMWVYFFWEYRGVLVSAVEAVADRGGAAG